MLMLLFDTIEYHELPIICPCASNAPSLLLANVRNMLLVLPALSAAGAQWCRRSVRRRSVVPALNDAGAQ